MALTLRRKLTLLALLLAVVRRAAGQGAVGVSFPCEAPGEDPDPQFPTDNLSCPIANQAFLECYSRAQLCDGVNDCSGGSDEGATLVSLECNNLLFVCTPDVEEIPIILLCDGNNDCIEGDDETTTLCENKCLLPYYGGCSYTRLCLTSEFDVNCGSCLPGFVLNPANPGGPCLLEIGLELLTYVGSENTGVTQEICITYFAVNSAFANGISGLIQSVFGGSFTAQLAPFATATGNDATINVDFSGAVLPLTATPTDVTPCVIVSIIDDIVLDDLEEFGVLLTSGNPGISVRPARNSATVTILDDDNFVTPVYQLPVYAVEEDVASGDIEICVAIVSVITTVLTADSTVNVVFISGGTADPGDDYLATANPSATLFFPANSPVTSNPQTSSFDCFTVPILDDGQFEGTESFDLSLDFETGLILVNPANPLTTPVVNIVDDEVGGVVVLTQDVYVGNEGTVVEVCAELESTTGGQPLSASQFVSVSTTPDTATVTPPADYNPIASPSLLPFPVGSVPGTQVCYDLTLESDNRVEGFESFLTIIVPVGTLLTTIAGRDQAEVVITDLTFAQFALDNSEYCIEEDQGPQVVFAQLVNGVTLATSIDVLVATLPGVPPDVATAGFDYTPTAVTLTFGPGNQGSMPVSIPIIDDILLENDENFQVQLSIPAAFSSLAEAVDPFLATVTIKDDDPILFDIEFLTLSVLESDPTATIVITPREPIPGPTPIELFVSTQDDSATGGDDFVAVVAQTVTFAVGATGPQFVQVTINEDLFVEGDETFGATAFSLDPRVRIMGDPEITIIDNDVVRYGFTEASYSVDENLGPLQAVLELLPSSGICLSDVLVSVTTVESSAESPEDYVTLVNFPVIFPAFSLPGSTMPVNIAIIDDLLVEALTPEQFIIQATSNDAVPAMTSAIGFIVDNDDPIVALSPLFQSIEEGDPLGSVEVCADIINPPIPFAIAVTVSTADGTATEPMDYTQLVQVLNFPSGVTERCVDIQINDNDVLDIFQETFFLNVVSNDADIAPGGGQATIQILEDNDQIFIDFQFPSYTFPEEGGVQMVCLVASRPLLADTMVNIVSSSGTATGNVDYDNVNTVVTFLAGSTEQCFPVTIVNDPLTEDDEVFELTAVLINPIFGVEIGPQGTVPVTIEDDDDVTISISTPSVIVSEPDGTATVCVEIESGTLTTGTAVVTFSTGGGSATAGVDYTPVNVDLIFDSSNQNSMMCIDIDIIDDLICEGLEYFGTQLTTNDPNVALGTSSGTVNIIDNDVADISVEVIEPGMFTGKVQECVDEELVFIISAANGVHKALGRGCEISVYTQDGTALGGDGSEECHDYYILDETCVITYDNPQCQISIVIFDNFNAEDKEHFFILTSSNDTSRCRILDDNTTIHIVDDEDCDDDVCGAFEICQELPCPDNFTCIGDGIGDDPHFAVALASGQTLCYTVQGEHGFAFNLISNDKVYMNAMFVPDANREEVTWLGTMGIVVKNNAYKRGNMTKLRFVAIDNEIHIDNQMVLQARNIEKITIENGKLMISEAPPTEGYKQPFVRVDLNDVELSFSIKFMTEHLDLYWHSTGQKTVDSHGLIGQFFNGDVELDEVRKILILPGKEPVPVQRKPLWAFMEREMGDSNNFCWVAMNPGFQGDGLIDGNYFDYLVDDVLSTEFKFKKM